MPRLPTVPSTELGMQWAERKDYVLTGRKDYDTLEVNSSKSCESRSYLWDHWQGLEGQWDKRKVS